jgi:hypothetical protein
MKPSPNHEALQAAIYDFERRIQLLEDVVHGVRHPELPVNLLLELYIDSMKQVDFAEESVRHWCRQVFLLDVRALLSMVRHTHDIHPWRGLLVLMDLYAAQGFEVAERARDHLLAISQELLNVQGLELLQPRDVMGHRLPIQTAISAISSRG